MRRARAALFDETTQTEINQDKEHYYIYYAIFCTSRIKNGLHTIAKVNFQIIRVNLEFFSLKFCLFPVVVWQ